MQKGERLFEVSCPAHEVGEAEGLDALLFLGWLYFTLPILNTYGSNR